MANKTLVLIPSALNVYNEMLFEVGSIPHVLIPLNGKPLLHYFVEEYSKKLVDCDFYILAKQNIGLIKDYIKENFNDKNNIHLLEIDVLKDLNSTISQGLKKITDLEKYDSIVINFGDTLIKDFDLEEKDTVYYSSKNESFRWTTFETNNNLITTIKDKNIYDLSNKMSNIFVGVFLIKHPKDFLYHIERSDEFYESLKNYLTNKSYLLKESKLWYDFGHVDNYYDVKKTFINKRFFNSLTVDFNRAITTKRSQDTNKFINEINWYLKLPDKLQFLVPRIFSYSLNHQDMFVEMEYYGYPSLSDLYLFGNYELGIWNKIFDSIFFSMKEMQKYRLELNKKELNDSIVDMYVDKTNKRIQDLRKDPFFNELLKKELIINSKKYPSFDSLLNDIEALSKELLTKNIDYLTILHGDLCLPNMLYDPKQRILKLIDPRGKFSCYGLYGDKRYDLAKLRHSFIGNYDFIINDLFTLDETENKIDYKFFKSDIQSKISEIFEYRLKQDYKEDYQEIKLIEALLFLNMVPLHADSRKRQLLMWSIGIEKISEILEHKKQTDTKIIITMAGLGSRFKNIGISRPKYMIVAKDKTLFEWSLLSLKNFFDKEFIFITRKEHNSIRFIEEKCNILGIKRFKIKELDYLTEGQAATVLTAKEFLKEYDPIMIYNIDTYVEPKELHPEDIKGNGWVPSFEAIGDHWSFVNFDGDYKVFDIAEKIRISAFGTIGLYYFSSLKEFSDIYDSFNFSIVKEKYIAPMYKKMINDTQKKVYSKLINKNSIHELGTPDEVLKFDPEFIKKNID